MSFEPGRVLCVNLYLGGQLSFASSARVVEHTAEGLMLWVAGGTPAWVVDLPEGRHLRDIPPEDRPAGGYRMRAGHRPPGGALLFQPAGAAHAVWWLFTPDMAFRGWYVNLEHRVERGTRIDVVDHELDLLVAPDRTWQWKDEQSFADKTGHPAFWTGAEAAAIRREGENLAGLARTGAFPFDGSWCAFVPPSSWETPPLPIQPAGVFGPARS